MDAPVIIENEEAWFLNQLEGRFVSLYFVNPGNATPTQLQKIPLDILTVGSDKANIVGKSRLLQKHYDATLGTFYLIQSDQYVAVR